MRRSNFFFKFILLIINIFALNLAFFLSFFARFFEFDSVKFFTEQYDSLLIFLNLVTIIVSIKDKTFTEFESISTTKVIGSIFKDIIVIILSILFFVVAIKGYQYSRQFHLLFSVILFLFVFVFRYFTFGFLFFYKQKKQRFKTIIIVSARDDISEMFNYIDIENLNDYRIKGIFSTSHQSIGDFSGYSILPIERLKSSIDNTTDEIIIFYNDNHKAKINDIIKDSENRGIRVRIVPNFISIGSRDLVLEYEYKLPLLRVRPEPLEDVNNYLLKRIFDLFVSFIFLITIFPIMYIVIAIIIKVSSKGPVFFKQKRTGQLNNEFYCYKFRTMVLNNNSDEMQAKKGDPRITWFGRFLRKSNLDEFPQFINVFKGDMSIVGPRPHMIKHTNEYSEIINNYKVRHFCKPGITGWAQVNGFRGETNKPELMQKRVELDIWYIENWTFFLDIKIIILTIYKMLTGDKKAF